MPPFDLQKTTAELATGYGSTETFEALRQGQLAKRMYLVQRLLSSAEGHPDAEAAGLPQAFAHLTRLQHEHPEVVGRLLSSPITGGWLLRALHHLANLPREDAGVVLRQTFGYPGWLAAAAMIRSRTAGEVTVVVRRGVVMLPGVGLLRLAAADVDGYGTAELRITTDGILTAAHRGRETTIDTTVSERSDQPGEWIPVGRLSSDDDPVDVILDDLDPFRTMDTRTMPTAISASQLRVWQHTFRGAWQTLQEYHPAYAAGMAAGLQSIVPLSAEPVVQVLSNTWPEAYGAIRAALPSGRFNLASVLIHEFQHAKLSALLDYVELTDPAAAQKRFYAPWRSDPRPAVGLLQGIYAHTAIADFWRVHRNHPDANKNLAETQFARWTVQVDRAITEFKNSGALNEAGASFVATVHRTLAPWLDEPLSDNAFWVAEEVVLAHQVAYRVRNLTPDEGHVRQLAQRWHSGDPAGEVHSFDRAFRPASLTVDWRKGDLPADYVRLAGAGSGVRAGAGAGDLALAAQDYPAAIAAYGAEIAKSPDAPDLWAGLAVALTRARPSDGMRPLTEATETVAALYGLLAAEQPGEPVGAEALVNWLTEGPR
ncbi:HEXXH motif-containing putative peptide modification protein [Streptomyces sp. NPDC051320]|uniref:aKG-HExxH-type peptide beta-hydroxylase n=1 Tax=Streptomyces sp. NPDC051320 TaxID=3154644 RepID=UPI0034374155